MPPQRKTRLIWLIALLLLAMILLPMQVSHAQGDDPPLPVLISANQVTASPYTNLRLRSEANTSSETLAILPRGEVLPVLGRNANATWFVLQYGDLTGWSLASWLEVSGDVAALPVVTHLSDLTASGSGSGADGIQVTTTANLRLREGPSTSTPTLLVVPRGSRLSAVQRNTASTWVRVAYRGYEGWLSVSFLSIDGNISSLPADAAPSVTPALEPTTPTQPITSNPIGAASLATQPLKAEANHAARLIAIVPVESTVLALATDTSRAWVLVQYGDVQGWLEAPYVGLSSGSLANLPTVSTVTAIFTGPDPRHSNTTGYPDVQIMIHWNTLANIDMEVIDPQGNVLSAFSRDTPNGGRYEHVVNEACTGVIDSAPVETASWAAGLAPLGTYTVRIHYKQSCLGSGETLFWISFRNNNVEEFWKWEVLQIGDEHTYQFTR